MSTNTSARRVVIYARISVSLESSVSLARQIESAEQYAAARGWQVVGTFKDDGVSATHNAPGARAGWRALLDSPQDFDVVLVWKVDRLARRVMDFLEADQELQKRGAAIAAVADPIDLSTPQGRAFATMLAVFAEMEAAAISARVAGARSKLIRSGRVVGGTVPYGWRSVPVRKGDGYVLEQDPDRIEYVRGMVERVRTGNSVYSVKQWLDEVGAPTPARSIKDRKAKNDDAEDDETVEAADVEPADKWAYTTVERILRHPILAGMTPFNPGNIKKRERGSEVLRDGDGLAVVDESVAVMPVGEWRAMVKSLDERDSAQSKPRALRAKTSALLSGLMWCGKHDDAVRMHRGTVNGRPGYYCPECNQSISRFEQHVIAEFLRAKGEWVRWSVVEEVHEGGAAQLPEIEHRLSELTALLQATDDDDEADRLSEQITGLRRMRREARATAPAVEYRPVRDETLTFAEDWETASTVEEQRAVLDDALTRIIVNKGRPGPSTVEKVLERLTFEWKDPQHVGPIETPDGES